MDNELLSGASQAKVTLVEAVLTVLRFVGPGKTAISKGGGGEINYSPISNIKITIIVDDIDGCF